MINKSTANYKIEKINSNEYILMVKIDGNYDWGDVIHTKDDLIELHELLGMIIGES